MNLTAILVRGILSMWSRVALLMVGLLLAGCSHLAQPEGPPPDADVAWAAPVVAGPRAVAYTDGPYLLDTGDRLRIFVYGQPNLSRIYIVDHGGMVGVPLIGSIRARGRTVQQLEAAIRSGLGSRFVKDPQVTVDVQQNRPFFILGEVRAAGQYPYVSGMTVQTAVAVAGGFGERADDRQFEVTRRVGPLVEKLIVPEDFLVQPGDTINVLERFL